MNDYIVNWDELPDIITKDEFYRICHISKSTARYLLQSGKVPCKYTGKKTRCYKIRKTDVMKYIKERNIFPESYSAPDGWYNGNYTGKLPKKLPPIILEDMHDYYIDLLNQYPDVLTIADITTVTGYGRKAVNNWCARGHLKHFNKSNKYYIPKVFLIDFLCSMQYKSIVKKSSWHIMTLINYSCWKRIHKSQDDKLHACSPNTQSISEK